jgi:riboflavin kinase / FMN adenylyltransferase
MRVIRGFPRRPGPARAVTLGVFDGLHLGHARILAALRRAADREGLTATVVTFDDHPQGTLAPERRPPRLATDVQRLERLRALGADEVLLVPFTRRLARTPPEAFARRVLAARLRARRVVVGADFAFGRDAAGDLPLLRRLGRELGFGVTVVPAFRRAGRVVSSTGLRRLVAAGRVAEARAQLGWPYTLHGRVVRGLHLGTAIGVPTANLAAVNEIVPAPGVYAVLARLSGRERPGLCHIGPRPTFFARGHASIEVHIPGWRGPLYGRTLAVAFLSRLRGIRKFSGGAALTRRIARDWEQARPLWPRGLRVGNFFLVKAAGSEYHDSPTLRRAAAGKIPGRRRRRDPFQGASR